MYKLLLGDCLELMKGIKDNSIDMILCDLPYGTTACKWDTIIPFEALWEQYKRIIKDNGAIVLFGSEPFSTLLRYSNLKMYKYDWHWIKKSPTGFTYAKYQPMRDVENICVFYKKRANYYPQGLKELETPIKKYRGKGQQGEIYRASLDDREYLVKYTNYPRNTLFFKPQRQGLHPTQKPVDLLEYLIKTYTKQGETVLDNCMGSGSTGVACINTNRRFIGFELDEKYFEIARKRIEEAKEKMMVFC